jgi:hypothetical protein
MISGLGKFDACLDLEYSRLGGLLIAWKNMCLLIHPNTRVNIWMIKVHRQPQTRPCWHIICPYTNHYLRHDVAIPSFPNKRGWLAPVAVDFPLGKYHIIDLANPGSLIFPAINFHLVYGFWRYVPIKSHYNLIHIP